MLGAFAAVVGATISLSETRQVDFLLYMDRAHKALSLGMSRYYLTSDPVNDQPPLRFLLAWPAASLPPKLSALIWNSLNSGAMVLGWRLASGRLPQLVLALALPGTLVIWALGQDDPLVLVGLVASLWLIQRDRPLLGGLALTLASIKPQLVFLVPVGLLLAGQGRAVLGFAAGCAAQLIAGVGLFGVGGMSALAGIWLRAGGSAPQYFVFSPTTVHGLLPGPIGYLTMFLGAALAMAIARVRRQRLEIVYAASILGSLFATPFIHDYDLILYLPVWWWMAGEHWTRRAAFGAIALIASTLDLIILHLPSLWGVFDVHLVVLTPVASLVGLLVLTPAGQLSRRPGLAAGGHPA